MKSLMQRMHDDMLLGIHSSCTQPTTLYRAVFIVMNKKTMKSSVGLVATHIYQVILVS